MSIESYYEAFPGSKIPHISCGLPFPESCAKHVQGTFNASRVYIIASKTLSIHTDAVQRLETALDGKVVGKRIGMTPHTLWSECLEVTEDARGLDADLIITLGAGSLTDAAKIVSLALANDASTASDLDGLQSGQDWDSSRHVIKNAVLPIISIPTTLSGGEYQKLAGGTKDSTQQKHGFNHGTVGPSLVVLDAELTTTTPDQFWLSTGVRAIDHCVETLCSTTPHDVSSDEAAADGLRQLVPGLLRCKKDKQDLEARHLCQLGVVKAMVAVRSGVELGASHGIGHQLGPLGVGHGETSCILLPAVCRYNFKVNEKRQQKVKDILWQQAEVKAMLSEQGLHSDTSDLGDVLDCIISQLGMPRSLKAVGIGEDKLELLATNSLNDKWCRTNPIPLKTKAQVLEILNIVIG
ncbi:Fe-containing alcohol dehydrogenase [Venturia nashicola]|nr:Fe-containing alcohol dehydrogenase [Venturia nashicola]